MCPPSVLLRTTVSLPAEMLSPAWDSPKGRPGGRGGRTEASHNPGSLAASHAPQALRRHPLYQEEQDWVSPVDTA